METKWDKKWEKKEKEQFSQWKELYSLVMQLFDLGPVLFEILINDVERGVNIAVTRFVDDTKLTESIKSDPEKRGRWFSWQWGTVSEMACESQC